MVPGELTINHEKPPGSREGKAASDTEGREVFRREIPMRHIKIPKNDRFANPPNRDNSG